MKEDEWLLVAVLVVGLYFLWKHENGTVRVVSPASPPNGVPPPIGTATAGGVTQSAPSIAPGLNIPSGPSSSSSSSVSATVTTVSKGTESAVSAYTHVPLSSVGSLAQRAPTWAKIAIFPVGVTAIAQDVINNPVGSVTSAGKAIGSGAATAAKAVAGGAKSAANAVEGAAKTVLGWL